MESKNRHRGGKRSNRDEDDYKMILTDLFILLPHLYEIYTHVFVSTATVVFRVCRLLVKCC